MRLGLGIGLDFKVNAILQAFAQKYNPLVIFGSDLVTYYGNSVDELFADHRKAWEDSPELVTNGGFENADGWTLATEIQVVDGVLSFATSTTRWATTTSAQPLVAGRAYRVSLDVVRTSGTIEVFVGNTSSAAANSTGRHAFTIVTTAANQNIQVRSLGGGVFTIDNLSVKEIDLTKLRLYQDSAGTTPVTSVEQFVGLVLDQSQGLELGPDLLSNSVNWLSTTTPAWDVSVPGVASITNASAQADLRPSENSGNTFLPAVVGRRYEITFDLSADGPVTIYAFASSPVSTLVTQGSNRFVVTATNPTLLIRANTGRTATVSNWRVRELPGNHLSQPTATARPRLTRRVNLLRATEQFDSGEWIAVSNKPTVGVNATTSPIGTTTADKLTPAAVTGTHGVVFNSTRSAGTYTYTVYAKNAGYNRIGIRSYDGASYFLRGTVDLTTGTLVSDASQMGTWAIEDAGNGWWRIQVTGTAVGSFTPPSMEVLNTTLVQSTWTPNGVDGIFIWGADLRPASFATQAFPPYQRVTSDTDYDEVGFPAMLRFDGVDDALRTGDINLTTTAAISAIGTVQKNSDAALGVFFEFGPNVEANNGSFAVQTPPGSAYTGVGFLYKGDGSLRSLFNNAHPAPLTAVLSLHANIAGPRIEGFVNGVSIGSVISSAGAGNMGSFPLNVGARNLTTARLNGDIFALPMIVKRLMTPAELAAAEKAFGKSIGVLQ